MNNKLNLLVNFLAVDKMSGALRNIVGLGRDGTKSIRSLSGEAKKLEREMAKVQRAISQGAGNITQLVDREKDLENQLRQTNEQLKRQQRLAAIDADTRAMRRQADGYKSRGQDNLVGGAAMALPLVLATKQAMAFESAMADVRKVVNFDTPRQFARMSDDIVTLSTQIPMAAEGIAQIVAAAGRANIPRKELLRFAQDAAKMGVAFDMTGDEAGNMMAKWRTAFGLSQVGVTDLADQINALTNSYGGNALAVSGIVTRIGALGSVAGVTSSQVGAMAQLMNSVGVEEEIAATGIKNMMLSLTKGTAATKDQKKALSSLGLEASSLAKGMQKDAAGTITTVLSKISKLPKDAQASILSELFGSESVAAIAPLLTNLDQLRVNFAMVGDKAKYAGSMQKEYLSRIATTEGATGLAMNGLKAVNMELGKQLLPTVVEGSRKILEISRAVRQWTSTHPQLTSALVTGAAYLISFRLGLGAIQLAFGTLLGPFATALGFFRKVEGVSKFTMMLGRFKSVVTTVAPVAARAFGLLRTATMVLAKGVMRAGLMMLGNPMILAIVAIGLAIGVLAYLVYSNWGKIRAAFATGWQWVKDTLSAAPGWLRNLGGMMMQGLLSMIDPFGLRNRLLDVARNGIAAFKNFFGIKSPSRLLMQMGGHLTTGLAQGIDQGSRKPLRSMKRMATGVAGAGAIALTPMAAAAGTAPQGGGQGGAQGAITVQVYGAPGQSVDALADAVIRKIEQVKGVTARRSYEGDR